MFKIMDTYFFVVVYIFTASQDVNVPVQDDTDFVIKVVRNILK